MINIEIEGLFLSDTYCMFCGKKVILVEDEGYDISYEPCPHTLFIATDDGFIYRSILFDKHMKIVDVEESTLFESEEFEGIDFFTDNCKLRNSLKFSDYDPPPSNHGAYIGFFAYPEEDVDI